VPRHYEYSAPKTAQVMYTMGYKTQTHAKGFARNQHQLHGNDARRVRVNEPFTPRISKLDWGYKEKSVYF